MKISDLAEIDVNKSSLDLRSLLDDILHHALSSVSVESGAIILVNHQTQALELQVYKGYQQSPFGYGVCDRPQRMERAIAGLVARIDRILLLRDIGPRAMSNIPEIRSELFAPISNTDRVLAVLLLSSPCSDAFTDSEFATVEALCGVVSQPLLRALRHQWSCRKNDKEKNNDKTE